MAKKVKYRNPCILEHLLCDERKTANLLRLLRALDLKITVYSDGSWFDIV